MNLLQKTVCVLALCVAAAGLSGCVAVAFLVKPASLPDGQVIKDIAYSGDAADERQVLDLYQPEGDGWPVMLFVHGGGWVSGDKDLSFAGREVYGNIGRYYASRGIGVAVQNYHLQPTATWRDQVEDVARAYAWLKTHIAQHGGDPESIFLSGHSAGAQLVAYAALADVSLSRAVGGPATVCGIIAVSGAGYDLADQKTYDLDADPAYYRARFEPGSKTEDWQREGSVTTYLEPEHIDGEEPPLLIFYAEDEYPSIQRQAKVLYEEAVAAGLDVDIMAVPKFGHRRMAVNFGQRIGPLDDAVRSFIAEHRGCGK